MSAAATGLRRGDMVPYLRGTTPDGVPLNLRDYYMRRNLALLVVRDDAEGRAWLVEAAAVRDAVREEAGEVVAIVPPGMDVNGLPALVDDGALLGRLALADAPLPALLLTDRYGTLFASSSGETAEPGLRPRDIPGWHQFISCRCS